VKIRETGTHEPNSGSASVETTGALAHVCGTPNPVRNLNEISQLLGILLRPSWSREKSLRHPIWVTLTKLRDAAGPLQLELTKDGSPWPRGPERIDVVRPGHHGPHQNGTKLEEALQYLIRCQHTRRWTRHDVSESDVQLLIDEKSSGETRVTIVEPPTEGARTLGLDPLCAATQLPMMNVEAVGQVPRQEIGTPRRRDVTVTLPQSLPEPRRQDPQVD